MRASRLPPEGLPGLHEIMICLRSRNPAVAIAFAQRLSRRRCSVPRASPAACGTPPRPCAVLQQRPWVLWARFHVAWDPGLLEQEGLWQPPNEVFLKTRFRGPKYDFGEKLLKGLGGCLRAS